MLKQRALFILLSFDCFYTSDSQVSKTDSFLFAIISDLTISTDISSINLSCRPVKWLFLLYSVHHEWWSIGIRWYPVVFSGIIWYQMVFCGIKWYHMVSSRQRNTTQVQITRVPVLITSTVNKWSTRFGYDSHDDLGHWIGHWIGQVINRNRFDINILCSPDVRCQMSDFFK